MPLLLASQVLGVALTLPASEFLPVLRRAWVVGGALAVQWIGFPLVGLILWHLAPDDAGRGALVVAVAPAEITSPLIAIAAGGSAALAVSCMIGSLALSTVLTPLWIAATFGGHIGERSLIAELLLSVLVPLVVGVGARTGIPAIARYRRSSLDLAAVSVLLVVLVGAGSLRQGLDWWGVAEALGASLVLIALGAALGGITGRLFGLAAAGRRAVLFPVGMREFGVATAVAVAVVPGSVGVAGLAGLYGVLMMAASSLLAQRLNPAPPPQKESPDAAH